MNALGMYGGDRPIDPGVAGTEMPAFMQGQILANQQYAQQQEQQQRMQAQQFMLQQAQQGADNQQQFNQLASQAYSTPADQRNTLLGKMAALNPHEAMLQQQAFAQMDAGKKAQVQAQLEGIAQKFTAIAQDPDPQRQQAEYGALIAQAEASGKDMSMFKNVPPAVGAKMALAQISDVKGMMGLNGIGPSGQPRVVGDALVGPDGKVLYQAPEKSPWKLDPSSGVLVNPQTGQYRPVMPAGAQAAPGLNTSVQGTNGHTVQFNFPPGTPPEVIAAAKADAVAHGDIAPGAQLGGSQPLTLAQYKNQGKAKADGAPQTFGDPTKTGQDYLATLDPQIASQVQALDQGRMQFPSSFALKTPYWQGMLAAVSRYDPSFDAINYNARASARKSFTSGKEAQQVNALNTVAQHLSQLQEYANALGNSSFTPYNTAKNALEGTMGSPAPTNFNRTVLPVAQELERVWRGTGGSEADIQQWIKNLSSSSSPAQFKDAFTGLSDLIHGKLAALKDQYTQAMGTTANPYQFLSPTTQKLFEGMDAKDAGKFAADATAHNGLPNASPQGPTATNPQTGQRVQWNGSAWVPAQ